jgi:hypothetical protein
MNPPTTQTPTLPLDPATLAAMHSATFDALPPRPGASDAQKAAQRDGAVAFLAALLPRDPVQAMLAARLVGAHYAAMEYFRRAARDDLPTELHLRIVGKAVALCRLVERTARDLMQRQGNLVLRRPTALPAPSPASRPQPEPDATQASTPSRPPIPESRHERRRRERAERHLAAVGQRAARNTTTPENPMQQALRAQAAALAAATAKAVAA